MSMAEPGNICQEAVSVITSGANALGGPVVLILFGLIGNFYIIFFGLLFIAFLNFVVLILCCKGKRKRRRKR
jgi:hypothetical protein